VLGSHCLGLIKHHLQHTAAVSKQGLTQQRHRKRQRQSQQANEQQNKRTYGVQPLATKGSNQGTVVRHGEADERANKHTALQS